MLALRAALRRVSADGAFLLDIVLVLQSAAASSVPSPYEMRCVLISTMIQVGTCSELLLELCSAAKAAGCPNCERQLCSLVINTPLEPISETSRTFPSILSHPASVRCALSVASLLCQIAAAVAARFAFTLHNPTDRSTPPEFN